VLVALAAWQWLAPVREASKVVGDPSYQAAYYAPLIRFLERDVGGPVRVEVPFARAHWEAVHLAPYFPLARGWQTQLDVKYNALFYRPGAVTADAYRAWLARNAVAYVALPDAPLDPSVFIAIRVLTGLGEGAFYSNDRRLIAENTPVEKRSLGMGVVITGLAIGITIATVFAPNMIDLGSSVFATGDAWRMPFLILGAATLLVGVGIAIYFRGQERGLPYARATLHHGAYAAVGLGAVMAVYFIGDAAGLSDLEIAVLEVSLALALAIGIFARKGGELGPVIRSRDLLLINFAFIAVLWNLWFFSFWSVAIVADAAHSSFGRSALIAAFNAGAGILGFPTGGWLSDLAVRRGIGRKRLVVTFTALQCVLTVAFGIVITGGAPPVWLMAALLFGASTFFNAMQPIAHAMIADIAEPRLLGSAFGMNNMIGEIGAVLSPAVSGALRDATGGWEAAVFLDAGLIACAALLLLCVREAAKSRVLRREEEPRFTREPRPTRVRVGAG
jgi:ACS family D-galactonate transporter-like MFS transporter